jgi:hypothetical protein
MRRWTPSTHGKRTFLESVLPRIICGQHGKITASGPWPAHREIPSFRDRSRRRGRESRRQGDPPPDYH